MTKRQKEVCELIESGLSRQETADKLGLTYAVIWSHMKRARDNLGHATFERTYPRVAAVSPSFRSGKDAHNQPKISLPTDDDTYDDDQALGALEGEAQAIGIPKSKLQILKNRINFVKNSTEMLPPVLTDRELSEQVKRKIASLLLYMDDFSMSTAKLSEISTSFKALFEAKQLLDGKPTQILDHNQRLQLDDLLPKLIQEAKRRGVQMKDVNGNVFEHESEPEKPKELKLPPPSCRRGFPKGMTKAFFDRNGYKWPGDPDDPPRTKWKDIDPDGF